MDNHFYRNTEKRPLKNLLKKEGTINKKLIIIFFIIPILLFIIFNNKGLWQRVKLEKEKESINTQIKEEEKKQKYYLNEIYLLKNDSSKIEKVAREKFNMKRSGETIYKRKDNKN
ncbi:MAG TPA: septum formation initiator family protein [Ignavibacteria bacterium]|jgi:cell division protein FtsB